MGAAACCCSGECSGNIIQIVDVGLVDIEGQYYEKKLKEIQSMRKSSEWALKRSFEEEEEKELVAMKEQRESRPPEPQEAQSDPPDVKVEEGSLSFQTDQLLRVGNGLPAENSRSCKQSPSSREHFCEFTIFLKRKDKGTPWGFIIVQGTITKCTGEAAGDWKTNLRTVRPGDEIISVNGVTGDAPTLIEAMANQIEAEIGLRRKTRLTVEIIKRGPLGIRFENSTLEIIEILQGGPTMRYNDESAPSDQVRPGDKLVRVSQCASALPEKILHAIATAERGQLITLSFERPAPSDNLSSEVNALPTGDT